MVSIKRISAIFLSIVLVTGTIAVISPSFMTTEAAQAQPYYDEMDSYGPTDYTERNSYEPITVKDYENDNSYQKTYGKDNDNSYDKSQYQSSSSTSDYYKSQYPSYEGKDDRRDKSKDSKSVSLNKINCINTNLNINGENAGNVSIGNKGAAADGGYVGGGYSSVDDSDGYGSGDGYYNDGYNKNKKDNGFDCIINNNNTNINTVSGGNQTEPLTCEECFNANLTLAGIITDILELPGGISLFPVFPDISIGGNVMTIAQLCDYLEEQISEGIIPQTGLIDVIIAILERGSGISAGVSEESVEALYECLLDVEFG